MILDVIKLLIMQWIVFCLSVTSLVLTTTFEPFFFNLQDNTSPMEGVPVGDIGRQGTEAIFGLRVQRPAAV